MDVLWQRCLEQFLQQSYAHSNSAETIKQYRWTLHRFFAMFPHKSPDEMTRADVEAFLSRPFGSLRNRSGTTSIATRNQRLATLKSFYSYASNYDVERDGKSVPLMSGRVPTYGLRPGKPPRVYRAMSAEEIRRFFSVIPDTLIGRRDRALFLTYFYTARRRSEILDLKWGDIAEGMIVDSHGHSRRGYTYRFHNKGAHQEERETAELPEPAYAAIMRFLDGCGRREVIGPEEYVFIAFAHHGTSDVCTQRRLCNDRARVIMRNYARAAGLDERRLTLHSWRHTSARERYQRGSGVIEVKNLLRHNSLDTTYRYLEALSSTSDEGAALLEHAFRGL